MWLEYDDRVFDHLNDTNESIFLTELESEIVGFASFTTTDSEATIGRNSVLPEHGRKGIGTQQVQEVIRRCGDLSVKTISVVTGTHRFFDPAQRMYLKSGFSEVSRDDDGNGVGRVLVRYRLDLQESETV
jgi:GNAT superfamily N-acetyltransferase